MDSPVEVKSEMIDENYTEEMECSVNSLTESDRMQFVVDMKVETCFESEILGETGDSQAGRGELSEAEERGK